MLKIQWVFLIIILNIGLLGCADNVILLGQHYAGSDEKEVVLDNRLKISYFDRYAHQFSTLLVNLHKYIFSEVGHTPVLEQPKATANLVDNFLKNL